MVMELVDVVVDDHAMALSGGGGDGGAPRRAGPGQAGGPPGQVGQGTLVIRTEESIYEKMQ